MTSRGGAAADPPARAKIHHSLISSSFAQFRAQPFDRPRSQIWDAGERFICGFSEITDRFQSC